MAQHSREKRCPGTAGSVDSSAVPGLSPASRTVALQPVCAASRVLGSELGFQDVRIASSVAHLRAWRCSR